MRVTALPGRSHRITPILLAALIGLLLAGGLGPGRSVGEDIDSMASNVAAQRHLVARQEALLEQQVALTRTLTEAQAQLLALARDANATTDELLERVRRLEQLTQRLLREVREMNRRTGGDVPASAR